MNLNDILKEEFGFESLEDAYIVSRWMYSLGEPIMEDSTYATLHNYFQTTGKLTEYSERSWSSDPCPKDLLVKYKLQDYITDVVLTDKTESMDTISDYNELRRKYEFAKYPKVLTYKVDGFNINTLAYNGKAYKNTTRGRYTDAIDVSELKHYIPDLSKHLMGEVRIIGEAALSFANFEKLKRKFPERNLKSIRSSVRSAMAENGAMDLITYIPFKIIQSGKEARNLIETYLILKDLGFVTPNPVIVESYLDLLEKIKEMHENLDNFPYPTDGLVLSDLDGEHHMALRVGAWQDPVYYSYIEGYNESQGPSRNGLKLAIKPVDLGNSTQRQVNITNYRRVEALELYPGTPVAFVLRSKAIADIDVTSTLALQKLAIEAPTKLRKMIADRNNW